MNKDQQFPYVDLNSIATACKINILFIIILTLIGALAGFAYHVIRDAGRKQYGYQFTYSVIPESEYVLEDQLTNNDVEASVILGKSYMQTFAESSVQQQIIRKADVASGSGVLIESTRTNSEVVYSITVKAYNKEAVLKATKTLVDGMKSGIYAQIPGSRPILPQAVEQLTEADLFEISNESSVLKPVVVCAAALFVISIVIICLKVIRNGYITHPQVLSEVISIPIIGYAVTNVRRTGREPRG